MKLKKFLIRYFPPGIIIEYERSNGETEVKSLDLLNLTSETDARSLVEEILCEESLIPSNKKHYLVSLVQKLIKKVSSNHTQHFEVQKRLKAHLQPLTNCAFDKYGRRFLTGSYDQTCKMFDAISGEELLSLEEHSNIVYCVAFNNPFSNRIATASFDQTAKIWDADSGMCLSTLTGHTGEVVCLDFEPNGTSLATGSMDYEARIWDLETGESTLQLAGHEGEVISLAFNTEGDRLVTGSFDGTAKMWDLRSGKYFFK